MSRPVPTIADAVNHLMQEQSRIHALAGNAREQKRTVLAATLARDGAIIDLLLAEAVKIERREGPGYVGAYHEGVV